VLCCVSKPFLRGDNDRGWTADFDWLIKNDRNIEKAITQPYGLNPNGGKGNGATKPSPNKQDRNIEAGRIASAYYEAQAIGSANGDGGESGRGVESSLFGDSDGNVIDGTF